MTEMPLHIFRSICKYFKNELQPLELFIEGEEQALNQKKSYCELRINGPKIYNFSGFTRYDVFINVLIVEKQDKVDLYAIHKAVNIVAAAFKKSISVSNESGDYIGCLQLFVKDKREIDISHIGQLTPDIKEMQAMVQANYKMYLET